MVSPLPMASLPAGPAVSPPLNIAADLRIDYLASLRPGHHRRAFLIAHDTRFCRTVPPDLQDPGGAPGRGSVSSMTPTSRYFFRWAPVPTPRVPPPPPLTPIVVQSQDIPRFSGPGGLSTFALVKAS